MAYPPSNANPSNQLDSPSVDKIFINNTAVTMLTNSGHVKRSGMEVGNNCEINTSNGTTNMAICKVEPTAISTAISILFLYAIQTADACSAAFPTKATIITPINNSVQPNVSATTLNVSTRCSEIKATAPVENARKIIAFPFPHSGVSSE